MPATTIPENPKPGERYAEVNYRTGLWSVRLWRADPTQEPPVVFGRDMAEADARLLVFGGAAVAEAKKVCACLDKVQFMVCSQGKLRAALANFPE